MKNDRESWGELFRKELWPYGFFPVFIASGIVGFGDHLPLSQLPHVLRDVFVVVLCLGAPIHAISHRWGQRLGLHSPLRLRSLPLLAVVYLGSVFGGTELSILILGPLHDSANYAAEFGRVRTWVMGGFGVVFVASVLSAFGHIRDRLREVELRELRAQRAALGAQIQALQSRIQPHFLFNCLNTVASLIEEDPRRAERAIEQLSDLFRHTLEASSKRFVPLRAEIDAVRGFLDLEQLRFGDRLKLALHVEPDLEDAPVPPLVLQPLIENAIRHGIGERREGGRLEAHVSREADQLVLQVDDDGPGPGGSSHAGAGTALEDLRRRLDLLYGDRAQLHSGAGALGGYRIRVTLPLAPAAGDA